MQQRMSKVEKSTITPPLPMNPQEPENESRPAARDCSSEKCYFCVTVVDLWGWEGCDEENQEINTKVNKWRKCKTVVEFRGSGGLRPQSCTAILAPKRGAVIQKAKIW